MVTMDALEVLEFAVVVDGIRRISSACFRLRTSYCQSIIIHIVMYLIQVFSYDCQDCNNLVARFTGRSLPCSCFLHVKFLLTSFCLHLNPSRSSRRQRTLGVLRNGPPSFLKYHPMRAVFSYLHPRHFFCLELLLGEPS